MLACVFLEESWKPRRTRANTARTPIVFDVDVSSTAEGSWGDLISDTVKLCSNKSRIFVPDKHNTYVAARKAASRYVPAERIKSRGT
jgi:hypothetical protein